jgi:hypothetical protein
MHPLAVFSQLEQSQARGSPAYERKEVLMTQQQEAGGQAGHPTTMAASIATWRAEGIHARGTCWQPDES